MGIAPPPKSYSSMDENLLKNPPSPPTTAEKISIGADYVLVAFVIIAIAAIPFTFIFTFFGIEGIGIALLCIVFLVFLFYVVGSIATKR